MSWEYLLKPLGGVWIALVMFFFFNTGYSDLLNVFLQEDMELSVSKNKPTVNEEDLVKLKKFTEDFGQEG